jgi:hypothetical protein
MLFIHRNFNALKNKCSNILYITGITVDLPLSEKKKAAGALSNKPLVPCFKYVRIPANTNEPYEQLTAMLPLNEDGTVLAGDQIPNLVKGFFADNNKGFSNEVNIDASFFALFLSFSLCFVSKLHISIFHTTHSVDMYIV